MTPKDKQKLAMHLEMKASIDEETSLPPPPSPAPQVQKRCSTINPLPEKLDDDDEEEDFAEPQTTQKRQPLPALQTGAVDSATAKLIQMSEAIEKAAKESQLRDRAAASPI